MHCFSAYARQANIEQAWGYDIGLVFGIHKYEIGTALE